MSTEAKTICLVCGQVPSDFLRAADDLCIGCDAALQANHEITLKLLRTKQGVINELRQKLSAAQELLAADRGEQ